MCFVPELEANFMKFSIIFLIVEQALSMDPSSTEHCMHFMEPFQLKSKNIRTNLVKFALEHAMPRGD